MITVLEDYTPESARQKQETVELRNQLRELQLEIEYLSGISQTNKREIERLKLQMENLQIRRFYSPYNALVGMSDSLD